MPQRTKMRETTAAAPATRVRPDALIPLPLTDGDNEAEVLSFLDERPVHTAVMGGYVRDNGLESPFNRGTFYACRNREGRLEGVALVGHAVFVEARTDAALEAFARLAQRHRSAHMLMGERDTIRRFWQHYSGGGQAARLFCRELLFELRWPVETREPVPGLRPATLEDLMLVMPVHAALAYLESGVNPLEVDLQGFRLRCARRVEQGRVWVLVEDGELVFKADVISETPGCVYVEGLYVNPQKRGRGYGTRCLSQMTRWLLTRARAVSALVNEENFAARALLAKAGFKARGHYDTIFLEAAGDPEAAPQS